MNYFLVIPAQTGIQQPAEIHKLDSGSKLRSVRNDGLLRASLSVKVYLPQRGALLIRVNQHSHKTAPRTGNTR